MSGEAHNESVRLTHLWGRRGFWQIQIRWIVAPSILGSALLARVIGFEFRILPVAIIALCVAAYNVLFLWLGRRRVDVLEAGLRFDKVLTTIGMMADYAALLFLFHFTGGVSSPILVFLIFHVIIAAIQFRTRFSYKIAAIAAAGVWIMLWIQLAGWLPPAGVTFRGQPVHALDRPAYMVAVLSAFTATLFLSAAIASWIMHRFQRRVSELVQERTQFMLHTAHNLRAPLGAGLSMLDLVKEGYMGPVAPKQREIFSKIDNRLTALHRMIGEILTIARTRDWSHEITDVVVDLKQLAQRTAETFLAEAASRNIRFEVTADDDLPDIDSGADLLDQVMENLVSNALKYTPEKGKVSVCFTRSGPDEVRITVEDDGIGIPTDEQDGLFREFFRASNAKRILAAGTGLGLVLVKKTVERHRGRVHLTSEVGKGTTIVIDLPIRRP